MICQDLGMSAYAVIYELFYLKIKVVRFIVKHQTKCNRQIQKCTIRRFERQLRLKNDRCMATDDHHESSALDEYSYVVVG
jgi:hypothetical protein